jgi:hypothetical protein
VAGNSRARRRPVRPVVHGELFRQPQPLSAGGFAAEHPDVQQPGAGGKLEHRSNRFPTSAQNPYLNFASFAYPAAFTPGTLGRNTFEGPGLNWSQLSLSKWWRVRERARFQLRFDGYNFPFKQPNFANPSSVYNLNSPGSFARMTGVQGSFSALGSGRPNFYAIGRFEF